MHSLMTLPPELRDNIITYVLNTPKSEAPSLPAADTPVHGIRTFENPNLKPPTNPWLIKYRPEVYATSITPLLLVNHQMHAEALSALQRMGRDAHAYELDIILHNEIDLLPTWLRVPALSTDVESVRANFRIAGSHDPQNASHDDLYAKKYPGYCGFAIGDGAPPAMDFQLYCVLERFLRVGPTGECSDRDADWSVTIKTLDINVETPRDVLYERFRPPLSLAWWPKIKTEGHVLDPTYLARDIGRCLRSLFGMRGEYAKFGEVLYTQLDWLTVRLDGEIMWKWDVADELMRCNYGSCSEEDSLQWRIEVNQRRRSRGLRTAQL